MNGIKKDSFWTHKALSAGQQAAQLNDSLPEVHFVLGSVYSDTGRYALGPLRRIEASQQVSSRNSQRLPKSSRAALRLPGGWGRVAPAKPAIG
jgi:hypothetical protein